MFWSTVTVFPRKYTLSPEVGTTPFSQVDVLDQFPSAIATLIAIMITDFVFVDQAFQEKEYFLVLLLLNWHW